MSTSLDRRSFLTLGGAGLGALALGACGGPSVSSPGEARSSAAQVDLTGVKPASEITFWTNHPGKSRDIEAALAEKFTQQHQIKVNLVTAGATYEEVAQKFQTAQQGGQLPHVVVFSDIWWFRYYLNEAVIPLDSVLKQLEVQTSDYVTSLWQDYSYAGSQWAVPYARSTPVFYYNRDMFAAAGLPDRAPKTWSELAEWAPRLKAANPSIQFVHMYPALADYDSWSLQNKIWGEGGSLSKEWEITCDAPEVVKVLQFTQDSVHVGKWAGVSSKDAGADFSSGAVASYVGSTGSLVGVLNAAKFNVGVGFLPGGSKATDKVCPTGGAGLGIPKAVSKEHQLAAAMFLKFLGEPESTAAFAAATGYLPVRTSADMSEVVAKRPQAKVAIDQLEHTRTQDYIRVFLPGGDREVGMASADILNQKADVQQRLTRLKATLTEIYTNDVKPKLK